MSDKKKTLKIREIVDDRKAEGSVTNDDDDTHQCASFVTHAPTSKVFKIVHGKYKLSRFTAFSILVPEDDADRVYTALSTSTNQYHEWTIDEEDINVEDIPSTPSCLGFLMPPSNALPETIHKKRKKLSEDEVLNIILTRGTVPVKKCVVCHLKKKSYTRSDQYVWIDFGRLYIELNDGNPRTCDEVVKYLKWIRNGDLFLGEGNYKEQYRYVVDKVEVLGESEMVATKNMMMVKKNVRIVKKNMRRNKNNFAKNVWIESWDEWLKEFQKICRKELTWERYSQKEKDHRGRLLNGGDRVLRWLLPNGLNY